MGIVMNFVRRALGGKALGVERPRTLETWLDAECSRCHENTWKLRRCIKAESSSLVECRERVCPECAARHQEKHGRYAHAPGPFVDDNNAGGH